MPLVLVPAPGSWEAAAEFPPQTEDAKLFVKVGDVRETIVLEPRTRPELETLIRETLTLDPRPAYKRESNDEREYGVLLDCYNVRWRVTGDKVEVLEIIFVA